MLGLAPRSFCAAVAAAAALSLATTSEAAVGPLLETTWGQSGAYQSQTPTLDDNPTYPGCTSISTAQVLYYYQYRDQALGQISYVLDNVGMTHDAVDNDVLSLDFTQYSYDFGAMSPSLDRATASEKEATATFLFHVAASLQAQFGYDEGSSATGRKIENAFRYTWGYNNKPRREMTIISKDAFGYSAMEWADLVRSELDEGRPVLYMALMESGPAGHSFVIDGYADDGTVHVNWGWGGYGNGYYDPNVLEDPSGRRWNRGAMIFLGLEPEPGYAKQLLPAGATASWNGTGSIISYSTGTAAGYGITQDEAMIHPDSPDAPAVFFQWEVDARDGRRLEIAAEGMTHATITYGPWDDRSADRTHRSVQLPFILDPQVDGFDANDGDYFVVQVAFDETPAQSKVVEARATKTTGSAAAGMAGAAVNVDEHAWNGNGSVISYSSGTKTGYGMTYDVAAVSPTSLSAPVVYFQWEIDSRDGRKLQLSAETLEQATVTVGTWNDRSADVTEAVTLPYTIDPEALGLASTDGTYLVVRVSFDDNPSSLEMVEARTTE